MFNSHACSVDKFLLLTIVNFFIGTTPFVHTLLCTNVALALSFGVP